MQKSFLVIALLFVSAMTVATIGCEPDTSPQSIDDNSNTDGDADSDVDGDTDTDADTDTDTDADNDADTDADNDADTDADSDSDSEPTSSCETMPFDIELQPINMLILLDRSASMVESKFNGVTFEQVIDSALKEVVGDPENNLVYFGLVAFPSQSCKKEDVTKAQEICYAADSVTVPIGQGNGDTITQQLDALDTCGGTPIAASLQWAKSYLETNLTAELLQNPTYILLATDGAPNCSDDLSIDTCTNTNPSSDLNLPQQCLDDAASKEAAMALYQNGAGFVATAVDTQEQFTISVPTYVVGVGNDLAAWETVMNEIANGGGGTTTTDGSSSQYFQATDTAAVTSAFKDIVAEATPCTFPIPWEKIDLKASQKACELVKAFPVNDGVVDSESEIPFSSDCSNTQGWHYQNLTGEVKGQTLEACATVELCSESCEDLKYGRLESLSFKFGCRPVIK